MAQEQLGQILSVFAVVLGAAGNEGLAEFLEADRVDGIEGDPGVGFQEDDEISRRLFQADGDTAWGWSRRSWTSQSWSASGEVATVCFSTVPVRVSMRCRSALRSERSRPMTRS